MPGSPFMIFLIALLALVQPVVADTGDDLTLDTINMFPSRTVYLVSMFGSLCRGCRGWPVDYVHLLRRHLRYSWCVGHVHSLA